jgi:DNA helicase HerA-like ATPase
MTAAELVAELLAEEIRSHQRAVGVLVKDVPYLRADVVLRSLASLIEQGVDLRIAYMRDGGAEAGAAAGLGGDVFDVSVERAEGWRNEPSLEATIVVIAAGNESRLSSLNEFEEVGPRRLKRRLAERGIGRFADVNEVQPVWWTLLRDDARVSLSELADYYLALDVLEDQEIITRASREIGRLGMLPDPELFNRPRNAQIARRIEDNRRLVGRLQTLTERDRLVIAQTIASQEAPDDRDRLTGAYQRLRRMRRQATSEPLTLSEAQTLLGLSRPRSGRDSSTGGGRQDRMTLSDLAAQTVLEGDDADEIAVSVLKSLTEQLDNVADSALKPERLGVELNDGTNVQAPVRTDLLNLVIRLVGPDHFGGHVQAPGENLDEMLRRFQGDEQVRRRWSRSEIDEFLSSVSDTATDEVRERFDAYVDARGEVMPYIKALCADPLAVAASRSARASLLKLVESYQGLLDAVDRNNAALAEAFGGEVDALIGSLLLLDVIVLENERGTVALLAPTHPLYVWHAAEFCRVVDEQRTTLSERDAALVRQAAGQLPNFLTSISLPPVTGEAPETLPLVGRVGPLPYYGTAAESAVSGDGREAVRELLRTYLTSDPSARHQLRLTLLDPPDAGPYLVLLCDLADEEELDGAHLTVLHHPREKAGADLHLEAEDEYRVAQRFSATAARRRFTIEIDTVSHGRMLEDALPPHIAVVFDQTQGHRDKLQPADQPIQPLALTQRMRYLPRRRTVELVPSPGGVFAAYFGVARHLSPALSASHFTLHQDEELRSQLSAAADRTHWFVFADRNIDRDLTIGALRIYTTREGERDVVAFAGATDAFRRALKDVAGRYNTAISGRELDGLLRELTDLMDTGVLWLRPGPDGATDHARVKGVLGTLIASRWYRQSSPPGKRRMVISLDEPAARKWLHLAEDPKRADLLGIESGEDGLRVEVLEVKAVDAPAQEYRVQGDVISGAAVAQILSTRRLLREVFAPHQEHELITTPARRELLRANAFRELTKSRYSADERKAWVQVLESALRGETPTEVEAGLIDVRIGADIDTLAPPSVARADDDGVSVGISITTLNEQEVVELRQQVPPRTAQDDGEADASEPPGGTGPRPQRPGPAPEGGRTSTEQGIGGPASSKQVAGADEHDVLRRPRAVIGTAPGAYGKPRPVSFDPELPEIPLPNAHMSITGETGSGKTQATKAILKDLTGGDGMPVLILDFKDDYSAVDYAEGERLEIHDVSFGGLPFNPLAPPIDVRTGRVAPMSHVHQLAEILKRVYKLGDQQTFHLREAMKSAYAAQGLSSSPFVPKGDEWWPAFDAVRPILDEGEHSALLGRLSPIFDLELFAAGADEAGLANMLDGRSVIRVSQLPGDQVKNAVAEVLLLALYNHMIRQPQPRRLTRLLVLDEAWRVTNSPFLEPLMREGRALGLGVILATQYPSDLVEAVAGATHTRVYFSQSLPEQIREIQRTLVGKTSGADAERLAAEIRGLAPLTCLMANRQYEPYVRVEVDPYYRRVAES